MQTKDTVYTRALDEELADTLIAISVIAKRLAQKLRQEMSEEKGVPTHEQNE